MTGKKRILPTAFLTAAMLTGCSLFDSEPPVISGVNESIAVRYNYKSGVDTEQFRNGVSAYDNVDGDVAVDISLDREINGTGDYTVTYTAADKKGNVAVQTASLKVTEPVLGKWLMSDRYDLETLESTYMEFNEDFTAKLVTDKNSVALRWEHDEELEEGTDTGGTFYWVDNAKGNFIVIANIQEDDDTLMMVAINANGEFLDNAYYYKLVE